RFLLAECYRMLGLQDLAGRNYRYVIDRFPESDKCAPSYFRILQYAYGDRNTAAADSVLEVYQSRYKIHPLYNSVILVVGKLYFRTERYGEAQELLLQIPRRSSRYFRAGFIAALSLVQLDRMGKALRVLENIRKNTLDNELRSEVSVVMGDIYLAQEKYRPALAYYRSVPAGALRYDYATARRARLHLHFEEYEKAEDVARAFMDEREDSKYYFEMASILESVHTKRGEKAKAAAVNGMVYKKIIDARFRFEVQEELAHLHDMKGEWRRIRHKAQAGGDEKSRREAEENLERLRRLERRCRSILKEHGVLSSDDPDENVPGLAELRYARLLRRNMKALRDTIQKRKATIEQLSSRLDKQDVDTALVRKIESSTRRLDDTEALYERTVASHNELRRVGWYRNAETERLNNEVQAKFIDWSFMRYLDKKEQLSEMNKRIAERRRMKAEQDSVSQKGATVVGLFASMDQTELKKSIKTSRLNLIGHIQSLLESSPGNRYVPQILFRLAELYFDEASEDFDKRLRSYEAAMAEESDATDLTFPEYDLEKVIEVYDQIIDNHPNDWIADDAHFYKAMALRKVGSEDEANEVLLALSENYPESEYFVEANMNIGRYYFERPKVRGGQGYKLAEEAYRRVLYYREHPQFVQALYHLGWCYYMQDQYDEAIAVFKYLVEEVKLDFDAMRMEEKQLVNPLLREEAVDFIAISFDEIGGVDAAVDFLDLIGNEDYAAMVVKRIAKLREEDLDYDAAVAVYKRLIEEYPTARPTPDAAVGLIKLYESTNRSQLAMAERQRFFDNYARGGRWREEVLKRDTARVAVVDSMAISIGLSVADAQYRKAENSGDHGTFAQAAQNYEKLMANYPNHPKAVDARWNVAVIHETKLDNPKKAYREYLSYSMLEAAPEERREQAALNAIAIAQQMMRSEPDVEKGKLGETADKLVRAAQNYIDQFPDGESLSDVVLSMGSLYFNRGMYSDAVGAYELVTRKGAGTPRYYEARFLIGQSNFGEEKWLPAADAFAEVAQGSPDTGKRDEAHKLMLQCKFLYAKQLAEAGELEKAAYAFEEMEEKYPGSKYGDVALFNAAEAWEGLEKWGNASKSYRLLQRKYPQSKLAPDALFNAAGDYEKADDYDKAAETYEFLATNYPDHEKAKDALFNVGFCYEKLGKLEKMAEANERYSLMYPNEADVEAMLLRSAEFYFKAEMYEKARRAYRNFVQRFPRSDRSVEALYMVAESYAQEDDPQNAAMNYAQAEQQNRRLGEEGGQTNNYYAAEAAYKLASQKQNEFNAVHFDGKPEVLKAKKARKTEFLKEAAKNYQRVMIYQSKRMFEAGYRIGKLYEDFAAVWREQPVAEKNAIKAAVNQKDICMASAKLLKKAFAPYEKVLELGAKVDSLEKEQKKWIDSSRIALARSHFASGDYMVQGIRAMQNAPIPKEIESQPLYLLQYLKQILETLEPMKSQTRDYFLAAYRELENAGVKGEMADKCADEFARLNYLIPSDYDKLAQRILKTSDLLPDDLSVEEREELIFQFEDMIFELQDKALFGYEDALERAKREGMTEDQWYRQVLKALARLSPETYGESFYESVVFTTDKNWIVRVDSVENWVEAKPPQNGWQKVSKTSRGRGAPFPVGKPRAVWGGGESSRRIFARRNLHVNGVPRDASLYIATCSAYKFYVNGVLVTSDTAEMRSLDLIDSITGVASLFKGGDNIVAFQGENADGSCHAVAIAVEVMVDTTKRFPSKLKPPPAAPAPVAFGANDSSTERWGVDTLIAGAAGAVNEQSAADSSATGPIDYAEAFKNRGELLVAIDDYVRRENETAMKIKRERMKVQKIRLKIDGLEEKIAEVKNDKKNLKEKLGSMGRKK
ncbi:MAG: tetratricopeptide repeat protein, partial [Chitinivibrionales bacterium]|nr:tetratricopeptide repeat protein [Chitinivibrionales bacterium]MBD3358006.1 tetratricopeptide repeat protein [Chitinivibrionales bacterium]